MKKLYTVLAGLLLFTAAAEAQISFANKNSRLVTPAFHSGCPVAVADWNGDGLDDIIRLDEGHICYVEVQKTNAQYESIYLGDFQGGSGWAWAMTVADVDHNGYLDIAAGGYGPNIKILMSDGNQPGTMVSLVNSNFFAQNMTFADFNNDGWIDLFCCDDNAQSHIFMNTGGGSFVESTTTINFDVTSTDDSGNYGSVWTDFDNDGDLDLYIAKCRQGVNDPNDGRRINVMFVNDGNGNFTEDAGTYNLNIGWQTWTASFGDIDNDGDLDLLVTNHDYQSQILENDGSGHFTDITATTGFDITDITPIQSVMEDFDNDGFVDLFITGSDHRFYRNNGNKTFTKLNGDALFNTDDMESFAIGDLNHDGRVDIYGGYAGIYTNPSNIDDVIWMNTTRNQNHFLGVWLEGTVSNRGAIGARALIYGAWGVQIREVAAGEGYGRANSPILHFGLGTTTQIDSVVVWFPSGITTTIINPSADQFLHVIENDCVSPDAGITYSLSDYYICTGSTETLTATPGYTYLWSDSSTASTLAITAGGEYNVIVSDNANNCESVLPTITIEENPDQTPVLTATGDLEFCDGGSVIIESTPGLLAYTWSDGSTTQNITATQSGLYSVMVQGYCAQFSSDTLEVLSHLIAAPVTTTMVSLPAPASTQLTATGTTLNWYDSATGTIPVATGSTFTTPVITANTSYWVENSENFGGGNFNTGRLNANGASYSGNTTNAQMYFTVFENCELTSVKVYTDLAGTRRFELRNTGGSVLQFVDVPLIADSQIVTLNFTLVPGDYIISTNSAVNQAIPGWGNVSPKLLRHNSGTNYPYTIPDALSITGNNFGGQYYYYFYDWQVKKEGLNCYSPRVQVDILLTTGITELSTAGISMYPNPSAGLLNIRQTSGKNWDLLIFDATGRQVYSGALRGVSAEISLSGLTAGIYQVVFRNGQEQISSRLVRQ